MVNPFLRTNSYKELQQALQERRGPLAVTGTVDPVKAQILVALNSAAQVSAKNAGVKFGGSWKLMVVKDEMTGKQFVKDIHAFSENAWYYPAKDFLFYQADTQGTLITRQRVEVLRHLMEDDGGVIVASIDALMDKVLEKEKFTESVLRISPGMVMEMEALTQKLTNLGYERMTEVEAMGEYSVRGGIADIYPFTAENPIRIEFWDTEVDNIRSFDVDSQRSIESLEEAEIYPASDRARAKNGEEKEVSLLDYFGEDSIFFLDEPDRLRERGETVETEFRESFEARLTEMQKHARLTEMLEANGMGVQDEKDPDKLIYSIDNIMDRLCDGRTVAFSTLGTNLSRMQTALSFRFDTGEVVPYKSGFELLIKDLKHWQKENYEIVLLSPSRTRASRLAQDLRDYELRAYCPDTGDYGGEAKNAKSGETGYRAAGNASDGSLRVAREQAERGAIQVRFGVLNSGYQFPAEKFVLLTEGDMFGNANVVRKKRKQKKFDGQKISKLSELSVGDYVVHEDHGIGIYKGIERIKSEGVTKDYIKVEYGDGGNLYLPATKLEGIQKYASQDIGKAPKLNKLNGNEWQKTRSRVQHAVKEIAKDLVKLYAARQSDSGYKYGKDTIWQKEFEEMFPYEETADQEIAIDATKADMESHKIMDRLICGDVGYGKTEIALRAAFKAVQDSKQVAYLVPTTILAQQVYNTFVERMKGFPVNIALLCRFRTPQQIKKSIEDVKAGRVDIVIGTHRLLSKDVEFKDLGLLIIDEEQRFGVTHKERIKNLKKNVDVLTLSATPIPRTLHMSLAGIRDMSVLEEPPIDRQPIQTYVMEYNDELIREAISRELARVGQVYYVYNRVNNIADIAGHIQKLCPEARISYAHGQMSENQLEDIMLQFINGEIDVLVSTTIIETGLDIPNANTLIIQDAERMGLSQLYQLRGRVGRSSRTAYAFLMYRRGKMLSEESEKRLKAIREFTQLGSGIRIAMRDLEIRGAGNVLGAEQHGHMEAVGYDLYCKLLNTAVMEEKGEAKEEAEFDTQINCDIDAFIPDSYISNEAQKLDTYKRISSITGDEDFSDIQDELIDRFGELPVECENLLYIAKLRVLAHQCYATEVDIQKGMFKIVLDSKADIKVDAIPEVVKENHGHLRFSGGAVPMMVFRQSTREKTWTITATMEHLENTLRKIKKADTDEAMIK
ncbi:transcription-repair coupling factor [Oribacterium sp. WCC10]|uniref:transcription-repair coupling factor n=1 Tax=Oribacterium sp. WCC10 TaxID=1855343 RepID=UPI0008EFB81C|nr:transcription-repair coupling factor [Oribacterium sp. WCC10]SFG14896.1 transcription-repair coupling factor [Oribacterium sp. WCC10]